MTKRLVYLFSSGKEYNKSKSFNLFERYLILTRVSIYVLIKHNIILSNANSSTYTYFYKSYKLL